MVDVRKLSLYKDKIDFKTNAKGRTDCTFTNYDSLDDKIDEFYYYKQFIKFGLVGLQEMQAAYP